MKRLLPKSMSGRVAAALLVAGVAALALAAKGYGVIEKTICADGWPSPSVGRGRCSGHGGVGTDYPVDTFVGLETVSWVELTRWPLLVGGIAMTLTGLLGLGYGLRRQGRKEVPTPENFLDLHLTVSRTPQGRIVTATTIDGSTASAPFAFDGLTDRGAQHLSELLKARHNLRFASNQDRAVETLGSDLFAALFPSDLEQLYRREFNTARSYDVGLRLVLELDDTTADLPWEYLHDQDRASFLALSYETSVVRLLPVSDVTRPQGLIDVVRILVMAARPAGVDVIDIETEQQRIADMLAPSVTAGHAVIEFVSGGTLDDLRRKVESFQPHVFHFAGHGVWDNAVDDGLLLFETPHGHEDRVTGRELGVLLVRPGLRLVVLNSCNAARSSQKDRFSGIATSLVAQGVPGALAMQFPIEDRSAAIFASTFLSQLVTTGSIDSALNEARQAMFTTQKRLEWGTPVLTTRVPIEQVLPLSQARLNTSGSAIPTGLQG